MRGVLALALLKLDGCILNLIIIQDLPSSVIKYYPSLLRMSSLSDIPTRDRVFSRCVTYRECGRAERLIGACIGEKNTRD